MDEVEKDIQEVIGPPPSGETHKTSADGGFEGASRTARTTESWAPARGSGDTLVLPDKDVADARSQDLVRNDGYVQSASIIRKDSIVGGAFRLNSQPRYRALGMSEQWAAEFQEEVEEKFQLAAESPNCWLDASRKMTFTEIIRMAVGVDVFWGEFLATVEWIRQKGRPFSTALQIVDVARLANPPGKMWSNRVSGGIAKDRYGAAEGYYIRNGHPYDIFNLGTKDHEFKYVPARKPWGRPQVIHVFDPSLPGQSRGISDLVAALKETRMAKRFRDVVLQNAVLNATYAATVESELPSETVFSQLGADGESAGEAVSQYAADYLSSISEYVKGGNNLKLDGVRIPHLFPGTKLNMQPVSNNSVGSEFEDSLSRYIAASLGMGVEELTKDFKDANYSSIRASMASTRRSMQSKKRRTADKIGNIIFRLWFEEQVNKGRLETVPASAPNIYEGLNMEAYTNAQWIGASLGQVDELKETQAAVLRMKAGISTQEDEAARLGSDWRRLNAQMEREQKDRQERGIALETDDNMMNAAQGTPSDGTGDAGGDEKDE